LLFYGILPDVFRRAMSKYKAVPPEYADREDDGDAEVPVAVRQTIRGNKALQMLEQPRCHHRIAKALIVAKPIAAFMDEVSYVDKVADGLLVSVADDATKNKLVKLNVQHITGMQGWKVTLSYAGQLSLVGERDSKLQVLKKQKQLANSKTLVSAQATCCGRLIR
jgi:hypothetical protein